MLNKLKATMKDLENFHKDEEGDAIQFFAIAALVLLMLGGGWAFLGPRIKQSWTKAGGELDSINNASY